MSDKYAHKRPLTDRRCDVAPGRPKRRFESYADAKKLVVGEDDARVYRCPLCRYWHIGHVRASSSDRRAP